MSVLPDSVREVLESAALAHLATINPDGSPQVTVIWVGLEGDEIVSAHLFPQQKLRNIARDPRVALSLEAPGVNAVGMRDYVVLHGRATIEVGGAPELLQELSQVYVGPGTSFPPMDDPPPGNRLRITVDRIGGVGPWTPPLL